MSTISIRNNVPEIAATKFTERVLPEEIVCG